MSACSAWERIRSAIRPSSSPAISGMTWISGRSSSSRPAFMSNDGNSGSGAALKLYDRMRSGNCYRARLMLALLALEYQRIAVNTAGGASIFLGTHQPVRGDHPSQAHDDPARSGENSSAWFLARNPRGQVPVLETDGKAIWDSIAIIVYLARRFGGEQWLPLEPHAMAGGTQWLILSPHEVLYE